MRKGNEVLLIKRANSHGSGTWSSPGGHLDFGETLEECAARETMEETGVVIKDISFLGITNDVFAADGKHYITVWMQGIYHAGKANVNAPYEMTDVAWFPWNQLPKPLFLPLHHLVSGEWYTSPVDGSFPRS